MYGTVCIYFRNNHQIFFEIIKFIVIFLFSDTKRFDVEVFNDLSLE